MKDLLKSFFAFGLATSLEKLIAFALVPLYVNVFSVQEYGILDLVQVIVGIFSVFGLLQLESSLQRYYYEFKGRSKQEFITFIFSIVFVLSLLIVLIAIFFSGLISRLLFDSDRFSDLIKISVLQIPFNNFIILSLLIFRYEKENLRFTVILLFKVILTLGLILLFVVKLKWSINGVFIAKLLGGILTSLVLIILIRNKFVFVFSSKYINKVFSYSLPLFPASLGSVLSSNLNRFFLNIFLTMTAVGIYAFSLRIASLMQMVYTAFIMAWGPFLFSKIKDANHKLYFAKILEVVIVPTMFLVFCLSLFSKELIQLFSPEEYNESIKYVGGLAFYFSLFILKEVVDIGPKVKEKTKFISYSYFITLVINFILLYIFIKLYGIAGVVIAMILTNTFLFLVSWIVSNKLYYIPYNFVKIIGFLLPTYFITILIMFIDFDFRIRVLVIFIYMIIGGFSLLNSLKKIKQIR